MPKYLSRSEASDYLASLGLKITKHTLQKMACVGGGPQFQIFGNRAVYNTEALDAWIAQKLRPPRRSTSEAA